MFVHSINNGVISDWEVKLQAIFLFFCFLKFYLFLERGERREKEREKRQCVVASRMPPTEDLAHNPGMCLDWESNQQPLGSQAGAQHQPGQQFFILFFDTPLYVLNLCH